MHRSHKMQASWSTAIASEESSIPRETVRFANRGCVIPAAFAKVSSSQSPDLSCRAQGDGWSAIKSSSKVFRAFKTFSEFVTTFMPGSTGRTHEAESTRAPVSTTQSRQTPIGVSFCKWQSVGIGVPLIRAASNTLVSAATCTGRPSIVISTGSGNLLIVLTILVSRVSSPCPLRSLCKSFSSSFFSLTSWTNPHALCLARPCRRRKTNPARTLPLQNVRIHFLAKMFQHGLHRRRNNLPQPADRSQTHGLAKLIDQSEIRAVLCFRQPAMCPSHQQVRHLLRPHPARHALPARFVPIKPHRIQRHIQHASRIVADHNRARTQHRTRIRELFEIEPHVHHRRRQIPRRRPRRRKRFQLPAAANPSCVVEKNFAHRDSHRHFKNSGLGRMATHAYKFQSTRTAFALRLEPLNTTRQNLRHVCKRLDVVQHCWFLPQPCLHREWRFVARLRSLAFDSLKERSFFAANISARADENLLIKSHLTFQNVFSKQAIVIAAPQLFAKNLFLQAILVPDVENSLFRSGNQPRHNHPLDHQMRKMRHDEAIFDRPRLALVSIAYDVFFRPRLLAHQIPFHARRKSCSAHPAEFRHLQFCQHAVPVFCCRQFSENTVLLILCVRVGSALHSRVFWMKLGNLFAKNRASRDRFRRG